MPGPSRFREVVARGSSTAGGVGSAIADAPGVPARLHAVSRPPVQAAEWECAVVAASDLGAEVVEAVARLDLGPPEREGVAARVIDSGLAADRELVAALGGEPALPAAEEAGWIAEPGDRPAEV